MNELLWSYEDVPRVTGVYEEDLKLHLKALEGGPWLQPATAGGYWRLPKEQIPNRIPRDRRRPRAKDEDESKTATSNDWYGVRQVMSEYCQEPNNLMLPGRYQHGWQWGTGVDGEVSATIGVYIQYGWPIWVWNQRNRQKAILSNMRAIAIGAPALYLEDWDIEPIPNSLLVIPYHSNPPWQIRAWWTRAAKAAGRLASGYSEATVLLYYRDFSEARSFYEDVGLRAVCLGGPYSCGFLGRLRYLIKKHSMIAGDRATTSAFYSGYWNRPYLLFDEPMQLEMEDPFEGPTGDVAFLKRQFPHFFSGTIDSDRTMYELGIENKRTPEELRELFGWNL